MPRRGISGTRRMRARVYRLDERLLVDFQQIIPLDLLEPGARIWVNRPGIGYVGVAEVLGPPVGEDGFMVDTDEGRKRYVDISAVRDALRERNSTPEKAERFVPVRWLCARPEREAMRETGLFGNQNPVAKPTAASWPHMVARLKAEFGISDEADAV